jgi:hypothetical protein
MKEKTVKCPLCGATLDLEPHPDNPDRLIAECDCRGSKVPVVDVPKGTFTPKEGE